MKTSTLTSVLLAAVLAACVPSVPIDNSTCPCKRGWTCCAIGNVCVKEATSCQAPAEPGHPDAGGSPVDTAADAAKTSPDAGKDSPDAPPEAIVPPRPVEPSYTLPGNLLGTWTGYQENLEPEFGSDVVKLVVSQKAGGSSQVIATLGTVSPPTPPTNPNETWPAGNGAGGNGGHSFSAPLIEGFAYSAALVRIDGERLRFLLSKTEPWQTWCALQTSHYDARVNRYVPETASAEATIDALFCSCDATECWVTGMGGPTFDLTFTPDTANGSTTAYGPHNVRLTHASPDGGPD